MMIETNHNETHTIAPMLPSSSDGSTTLDMRNMVKMVHSRFISITSAILIMLVL